MLSVKKNLCMHYIYSTNLKKIMSESRNLKHIAYNILDALQTLYLVLGFELNLTLK